MKAFSNKLIAHRGYRARFPENSVTGILAAIEAGAKHIECDVQMNADHDLVVLHDDNFLKTAESPESIFETRTADLNTISVHEFLRFGDAFYPEPVPLLSEVLDACLPFTDIQLFVEIKEESLNHWGLEHVMDALIAALEPYPNPCCILSFDEQAIRYSQRNSDLLCGWVLHHFNDASLNYAKVLAPDFLICNERKVPRNEPLPNGNWQWMLYDIVSTQQISQFSRLGCDLFETDYVGELISELAANDD